MQSSSQPAKPRRFDATKRSVPKPHTPALPKEDKNMNTIPNPATRRVTKAPVASPRTRVGAQPRAPLYQPKAIAQKPASANFKAVKPKFKSTRVSAASRLSPSPAPPALPSLLPLDPNCNEPSLPCLCCDGRSPQDNNSMFNHNHNNNNTISLRQQMQLPAPPGPLFQKQEEMRAKEEQPELASEEPQKDNAGSAAASLENNNESNDELDISNNAIKVDEDEDDDSSGDIDIDEEEEPDHYGDDEDDDDDTLVPSCCDCPPSLLDFSLTSSTSSSSTSISSCSDLDSDSADHSYSMSSSNDQDNMSFMLSPKVCSPLKAPESKPPARSLPSLPPSHNPFYLTSASPSSPDEGYPSALDSPDYLGIKEDSEMKLSLLDFLESVGEFGKMERFSQVIQVARWDLEGEQHWDVLRDRIDHLDRLEKVNREVKLAYIAKLHEKGFDLSDLEEQDLSDIMDEMGNIDIPWKLYKNPKGKMQDSQEFSDAGVDLTAPSDCEDPLAPDSLTPSPIEAPPKPPVRHASVTSDLHTYINISREPTSVASSPTPLSTFSLHTTSPTFTTFRCERSTPVTPPSVPPLPVSKPVPYLTLYTAPSPTIPTPTPPIPPPRTRHLARKEAQRRAALLAEQEKSPDSLPPPTTRPPPLPPPPVISISSSSPPAIPPPPALPPPPSFHALDVEIRKLLMLAGLTQAELLKISPELGNCVGGLEDEEDNIMSRCNYTIEDREEDKHSDNGLIDSLCYRSILEGKSEDSENKEERKETQKTTSFSEMARRRRRNTAYMSAPYYSTGPSSTNNSKEDDFEMLRYSSQRPSSPPPPPPPRPLPPIPSSAPPKMSTLQANSARPERFDWLIAFTPDADAPSKAPHFELRKRAVENTKKSNSSSSESSTSSSAPKITTFKELRNRKSSSPLTKFITDPEPDPSIITPDPDLLYNLKWRRDKVGDGTQWEYTSQAQALFMQPPPALTSMAALQEMLQRAEEESGKSKLCPSQNKLGYSVSDSSLWNLGTQWEHDNGKIEESGEGEVEVRGQADGERTAELLRTSAVRSVSFAGSVHRGEAWMARDVRPPVRGLGLSPQCLQEKRALVSAVSVAVEAIVAQFSTSRTIVQKALSGDSTVNPSLGRLVLQCLCPALHSLLTDGLKPHQSDLIAGRRPNSAWSLVQASTRPGSKTQALFTLQARVGDLPQLKQSKHRFNAFILGLLNIKSLDFWLSHLHTSSDVLETYYHPSSFMHLSLSACHSHFEELLLVLQPLGLLTFNLDLLFQHHHVDPHSPKIPGAASHDAAPHATNQPGETKKPEDKYMESLSEEDIGSGERGGGSASHPKTESSTATDEDLLETSPQLRWVKEKEISSLPLPDIDEDSLAQQAGQVMQQGWEVMVRWGGRLSQNLSELSLAAAKKDELKTEHLQRHSDFVPVNSSSSGGSSGSSGGSSSSGVVQMPWGLDRLFGAPKSLTSPCTHPAPARRPSQWLAPGVSVLTRMVSSSTAPMLKKVSEPPEETSAEPREEAEAEEMKDQPRPLRSVRTLCDHRGSGSELSFSKGEELQVLGGVDQDWIRCRRGNAVGLVPIGYASLIV